MTLTKTHPLFSKFDALCCRLSPENLSCDGEISRTEVNRRAAQIRREWIELEKQLGSKVTETDIYNLDNPLSP